MEQTNVAQGSPNLIQRISRNGQAEGIILLIALAVRLLGLGAHSFWFDEIVSLGWAASEPEWTWDKTLALVEDKHPPAYYITLHHWQEFLSWFGLERDDFALRFLGVLFGLLTVIAIYLLVRRLNGRRTGLLTALLVALSPVLIWYSQELRMFQPATAACVLATYLYIAALQQERRVVRLLLWSGFLFSIEYALYSYLVVAFFLPGLAISTLLIERRRLVRLGEATIIWGLVAWLWFPLARNAWLVNSSESPPGRFFGDTLPLLLRQLRIFTIWRAEWTTLQVALGLLIFGIFCFLGFLKRTKRDPGPYLLALWVGLPLLIALALQVTNQNLFKEDRYYLFLAPFVLWAVARGTLWLGARRSSLIWFGVLPPLLLLISLPGLWSVEQGREAWRSAVEYVVGYQERSVELPPAAVAHVAFVAPAVDWYLRPHYSFEEFPVYGLFGGELRGDVEEEIGPPLRGIEETLGAHTLWLFQSHLDGLDEERLVQRWLDDRYPLITEQFPPGISLRGYALQYQHPSLPLLHENALYPDEEIAPGLDLVACENLTPRLSARSEIMHPPSGWVHLRLWIRANREGVSLNPEAIRARVVDTEGVWGESLGRTRPILGEALAGGWPTGEVIRVELDVNMNPLTAAGKYGVRIGADDLDVEVDCGEVQIVDGEQ